MDYTELSGKQHSQLEQPRLRAILCRGKYIPAHERHSVARLKGGQHAACCDECENTGILSFVTCREANNSSASKTNVVFQHFS